MESLWIQILFCCQIALPQCVAIVLLGRLIGIVVDQWDMHVVIAGWFVAGLLNAMKFLEIDGAW